MQVLPCDYCNCGFLFEGDDLVIAQLRWRYHLVCEHPVEIGARDGMREILADQLSDVEASLYWSQNDLGKMEGLIVTTGTYRHLPEGATLDALVDLRHIPPISNPKDDNETSFPVTVKPADLSPSQAMDKLSSHMANAGTIVKELIEILVGIARRDDVVGGDRRDHAVQGRDLEYFE